MNANAIQSLDRKWIFWAIGTDSAYVADVIESLGGHAMQPRDATQCATHRLGLD